MQNFTLLASKLRKEFDGQAAFFPFTFAQTVVIFQTSPCSLVEYKHIFLMETKTFQLVISKEDPSVDLTIHVPFVNEKLVITATVCNEFRACLQSESNPIEVSMPSDIKETLR